MSLTTADLQNRLKGWKKNGNGFVACCPCHDDHKPSLGITPSGEKLLIHCIVCGAGYESVLKAIGLWSDGSDVVAEYVYRDEHGNPLFRVQRKANKQFPQQRWDGSKYLTGKGNMDGCRRVPFMLPELLASDDSETVFIVEGEKDVLNLRAIGLTATTSPQGAGKFHKCETAAFTGRRVVVIPDNDNPGRDHADSIGQGLQGIASEVRILHLGALYQMPEKADASDWLAAKYGGDNPAKTLRELGKTAPLWEPGAIEPEPKPEPPTFKSIRALIHEFPKLRQPVIHGLLRSGETMNIIAPQKRGKSWFAVDLALAVATGQPWLESYQTERGDVLLIDNELHGETLAGRVPKIAEARGLSIEHYGDNVFVDVMRGRLTDLHRMEQGYFSTIEPFRFKVIILDSFYRFLPDGVSENDNATIANCYNVLDRLALKLGCSFVLIHHSSKGNQSGKSVVDVGSGAGAQSRATDTHLVLRQHTEPEAVVLEAAVRSWKPIEPVALRWEFPVWNPDDTLDPADLKPEYSRAKKRKPAEPDPDPIVADEAADFAERFVGATPRTKAAIVDAAVLAGVTQTRASNLLKRACGRGLIHPWNNGHKQPLTYSTERQPELADVA